MIVSFDFVQPSTGSALSSSKTDHLTISIRGKEYSLREIDFLCRSCSEFLALKEKNLSKVCRENREILFAKLDSNLKIFIDLFILHI